MNNLFISYDLHAPVKNYDRVISKIKSLGGVPVLKSMWYLKSTSTASEVSKVIWAVMDADDTLLVVDSKNNSFSGYNLSELAKKRLVEDWQK